MLYTNDHKLNYDEALSRLDYWLSRIKDPRAMPALCLLSGMLIRERDNLYFEPK